MGKPVERHPAWPPIIDDVRERISVHEDAVGLACQELAPLAIDVAEAECGLARIAADAEEIEKLGVKPILGDYLVEEMHPKEGLIARHDTRRLAQDLLQLMMESRDAQLSATRGET